MNIHGEADRERRTDDHQGELNTLLDLVAPTSSGKRHGELYERKMKERKRLERARLRTATRCEGEAEELNGESVRRRVQTPPSASFAFNFGSRR